MKSLLLFVVILLLTGTTLMANTFYVSPLGDDTWSGTQTRPFRTIQHAAELLHAGDSCVLRAGQYEETVRPVNSGAAGAPITFRAYEGETVTITGADVVRGWTMNADNSYRAKWSGDLGKNNQLFFDEKMVFEARWPNRTSDDPLVAQAARIEQGGDGYIICNALPDLPDDAWKGAVIWVMAGSKWTSWTSMVTGYIAAEKKLLFTMPPAGWVRDFQHPKDAGEFYLVGGKVAFDDANEYYYNREEGQLYLRAPGDADPNAHLITAKQRLLAFDLKDRAYIQVIGVNINAATLDLENTAHCLLQGMHVRYISHTIGGATGSSLNEKTGIYVSGHDDTIRDCEIAYSAGDGVNLNGTNHRLINNWIHHTDYTGCYASTVRFYGSGHLISHNTINDTGRDLLQYSGTAHLIQFNDVSRCGLLAEDLGFTYTVATDGGNTELRYNWFHDNLSKLGGSGVYFDNFTSNYLVHHNVIWGVKGCTLQLNQPSNCITVFNNTVIGNFYHWGRWPEDRMYGDLLVNNLFTGHVDLHPDLVLADNIIGIPATQLTETNFSSATRPGVDMGRVIPGITDGYQGKSPDLGAYESGGSAWKAGHDFAVHPDPEYRLTATPYKNLLTNAGFEIGELEGWQKTDAGTAKRIFGGGDILKPASSRNSITGFSACLSGVGDDGLAQTVTGLLPNTHYTFAGYVKVAANDEAACLGVKDYGGAERTAPITETNWQLQTVDFTTGAHETSVTVFVRKTGKGTAYADWMSLLPRFE